MNLPIKITINKIKFISQNSLSQSVFIFFFLVATTQSAYTQVAVTGILKGKIRDGITKEPLFGVNVSIKGSTKTVTSISNGEYSLRPIKGSHTFVYRLKGYQTKEITLVKTEQGQEIYLNIHLFPLAESVISSSYNDSAKLTDSIVHRSFAKEQSLIIYNNSGYGKGLTGDIIKLPGIGSGTDKNSLLLVSRLNGVVVQQGIPNEPNHSFIISGMGERYNQFMLNGAILGSFDPLSNSYPLEGLPIEAIEETSVQKNGKASLTGSLGGGIININTKDFTNTNFMYFQFGMGFNEKTIGSDFYGDKRGSAEKAGFSGSQRSLPGQFPNIKSSVSYSEYNIQEKNYYAQQLSNNISPINYGSSPDQKITIGFGRNFKLKKRGAAVSLIVYFNQNNTHVADASTTQVAPDIAGNPYPFTSGKSVVFSQSLDSNYRYNARSSAIINSSIVFGKNKISFRNYLGSQLVNTYTKRLNLYKPDEDTLAHAGIRNLTSQQFFVNSQLAGEHVLGDKGKLKLDWQVTYTFHEQKNPDERNFLLREDSAKSGQYELATPLTNFNSLPERSPSSTENYNAISNTLLTNSGRLWRDYKDHNFTGNFNLGLPFNMFNTTHLLSGGIFIQENYRILNSDKLLYQGSGYYPLSSLLSPERYYPGGLEIKNLFVNENIYYEFFGKRDYSSYKATSNTGAAHFTLQNHVSKNILLDWGVRLETNSISGSNIQYFSSPGYKNTQVNTSNINSNVVNFNLLPSFNIEYNLHKKVNIFVAYFKTVNRPMLQELVPYAYFDAASFTLKTGNGLIRSTEIDNYKAGITFLKEALSSLSIIGFYKKIFQPIEYVLSPYGKGNVLSTPHNSPPATVGGVEASFKLNLGVAAPTLSAISLFANGNITQSKVTAGPIRSLVTPVVTAHSLSGSPNYSLNTGIVIHQNKLPELSLIYSNTGDYIIALGSGIVVLPSGQSVQAIPDYRMKGTNQLNIQLAQKLFKNNMQIVAGVNNLLSSSYLIYQDLNGDQKFGSGLVLSNLGGNGGGFYVSGTDNTIINIKQSPTYYFTLSYLF